MTINFAPRPDLAPPRLIGGKLHEHWTEQERRDAALWNLGPQHRAGLKPPPEPVYADIPAVPGSAADTANTWRGSFVGVEGTR